MIEETPAPGLCATRRARRCCDAALRLGARGRLPLGGHRRVRLDARRGAVLLPRGQHAPAGRARRDRGGDRHRSGRVDGAAGRGRAAAARRARRRRAGASIQVRLYAEDPGKDFQPSTGTLTEVRFPQDARVETWVESGTEVTPHYDPLLAKIIVHGATRAEALQRAARGARATRASTASRPTSTTCARSLRDDGVRARRRSPRATCTSFAYRAARRSRCSTAGTQTTVQDYPGRLGYWAVGVPPSGPMDDSRSGSPTASSATPTARRRSRSR